MEYLFTRQPMRGIIRSLDMQSEVDHEERRVGQRDPAGARVGVSASRRILVGGQAHRAVVPGPLVEW